jgi:predicted metalloprotease with PDZ domain
MIPRRLGLLPEETCLKRVNSELGQYYTNPYRSEKERDLGDWSEPLKIEVPYHRGFTFCLKSDALIRNLTDGKANLDNVALQLLEKRRAHENVQQRDWISSVSRFLDGRIAAQSLKEMLDGEIVIPPTNSLSGYGLQNIMAEPVELGFSTKSLFSRIISGVIQGSRAEAAGIRNGDHIISNTPLWKISQDFHCQMEMKILRADHELTIRYLPRARVAVDCWQFHPIE